MNTICVATIASIATLIAACSTAPSEPVARASPVASPAPVVTNIGGNWGLTVKTPMGPLEFKMTVIQNGTDISAKIEDSKGIYDYSGTINGNDVKLGHDSQGMPGMRIEYIGTVVGDAINGKAAFGSMGEGAFTAKRR